jgi:hypothetical protein
MIFSALDDFGLYDRVHSLFPQVRAACAAGFTGWPPGKYKLGQTDVEVIISSFKARSARQVRPQDPPRSLPPDRNQVQERSR